MRDERQVFIFMRYFTFRIMFLIFFLEIFSLPFTYLYSQENTPGSPESNEDQSKKEDSEQGKFNKKFDQFISSASQTLGALDSKISSFSSETTRSIDKIKIDINNIKTSTGSLEGKIGLLQSNLNILGDNISQSTVGFKTLLNELGTKIDSITEINDKEQLNEIDSLRVQYETGLDVIKLLYEKLLDLDHHYTSLKLHETYSDLTNPHAYEEFTKNLKAFTDSLSKNHEIKLPEFLKSNPYISTAYSLVFAITDLIGDKKNKEKQEKFAEMITILDFTSKMRDDFNILKYETTYLQATVQGLKVECESLFVDYVKEIGYKGKLPDSRQNDDWRDVKKQLYGTISSMKTKNETTLTKVKDMKFKIGKLVSFIDKYFLVISQGSDYYEKFDKMISNYMIYKREKEAKLPRKLNETFDKLVASIQETKEKFKTAYNVADVKGSKLRELLYGPFSRE